jgi:hypothetical protein
MVVALAEVSTGMATDAMDISAEARAMVARRGRMRRGKDIADMVRSGWGQAAAWPVVTSTFTTVIVAGWPWG